jgi:undecaprenyl-diphosphatase
VSRRQSSSLDGDRDDWLGPRRCRSITAAVTVVLPLALVIALAVMIRANPHVAWDGDILEWLERQRRAGLSSVLSWLTNIGAIYVVAPLAAIVTTVLLRQRRFRAATFVAGSLAISVALNASVKIIVHRHPPTMVTAIVRPAHFTFPSGHTMNSATLTATLIVLLWPTRWRWLGIGGGLVYALFVGLSRLYLGVHYPTDVLGGWLLSLALVSGLALALKVNKR